MFEGKENYKGVRIEDRKNNRVKRWRLRYSGKMNHSSMFTRRRIGENISAKPLCYFNCDRKLYCETRGLRGVNLLK